MYLLADTQPLSTPRDSTAAAVCVFPDDCLPTAPLLPLFTQIPIRCHFMTEDCFQNQRSKSVGSSIPESSPSLRQFEKTRQWKAGSP